MAVTPRWVSTAKSMNIEKLCQFHSIHRDHDIPLVFQPAAFSLITSSEIKKSGSAIISSDLASPA